MMVCKMMCKKGWKIVGMIVVIAGILGSWQPVLALEPVNFLLDWKISGVYAPYFLAVQQGYFAHEGIDIEFTEGQGSNLTVKIIADGKSHQIGEMDYSVLLKSVAKGLPVKAVFGIYQTSPLALISYAENPITTPEDFAGKTIAFVATGSGSQLFPVLLERNQIDPNAVTVMHTSFGGLIPLFLERRCDAVETYSNGQMFEVIRRQLSGENPRMSLFADFGVNLLSHGLVVNSDYLQTHEEIVAGVVRAVSQGWHDAIEKPEAAIDALLEYYPDHTEKRLLYLTQLEATVPLLQTPNTQGKPLGWMSEKDWEQTQEILFEYGGLEQTLPLETYYTNDYIPTSE